MFHRLIAPVQPELDRARATGDAGRYRELLHGVYAEWLSECPQAATPRVRPDEEFRDRMVAYLAESQLRKDFDPGLATLEMQMNAVIGTLQRIPDGSGRWLVSDGIWQVAALFKELIDKSYRMLGAAGVLAMDPDQATPTVAVRMEYSTFCQGWIPHLRPEDTGRFPAMFGLTAEYAPHCHSGTHRL